MNTSKIAVLSIWAEDVPTTTHFYRDVLGLPLLPHHGERPHFDLGGMYLTLLKGKPIPAQEMVPENFPLLALRVDDLDAMVEKLRIAKVKLLGVIESDGPSRWIKFYDPAGNLIELVEGL